LQLDALKLLSKSLWSKAANLDGTACNCCRKYGLYNANIYPTQCNCVRNQSNSNARYDEGRGPDEFD